MLFTFLFQLPVLGFFFPGLASDFGFFRLFIGFHTHHVGFSACFSLATPRLLFTFLFSFRFWVFSSVFRFPHPPRGFFCLLSSRCTQIALHFLVSASGFGFFRLFFGFHTHHVGFFACFSLATPRLLFTFLFQLPVLGFFGCFSVPTPTTWVFLLVFHSLHTYASATVTPPYACLRSSNSPCFACLPNNCSP